MSKLDDARRLCREFGGTEVDLWTLPHQVIEEHETRGRPIEECARSVVSGWLAKRAGQGDGLAEARLLELWHREVLHWCRWNRGRGIDADDVAQDTMVRMIERLHTITRPAGFRAWLWAVAWRVMKEHERTPFRRRWSGEAASEQLVQPDLGAEDALVNAERLADTRVVLQSLALDDRVLLWLAYVDQRTRSQISEDLGWPVGTVNRRLTQARKRFRREAARRGLGPRMASQREGA